MAKSKEKALAKILRKEGLSIRSIAEKLHVSKSSASRWCRDLELTQAQKDKLMREAIKAGNKGRMIGALMNKRRKEEKVSYYKTEG